MESTKGLGMLDNLKTVLATRVAVVVITAFGSALGTWLLATYPTVHNALCKAGGY